jgi:hypothetical protein
LGLGAYWGRGGRGPKNVKQSCAGTASCKS